jgi:hypothetical protein
MISRNHSDTGMDRASGTLTVCGHVTGMNPGVTVWIAPLALEGDPG